MPIKHNPKRVLVIARCSDCNIETCENRQQVGDIPDSCTLPPYLEERTNINKYALEHQARSYGNEQSE